MKILACQFQKTGEIRQSFSIVFYRFSSFNFQGKRPQDISHKFLHTSGPQIPRPEPKLFHCDTLGARRRLCCRNKEIGSETAWIWLSLGNSTWRGAHGSDELLAMQAQVEAIADSQRLERVINALKLGVFAVPLVISRNVRVGHDLFKAHDNEYLLYRSGAGFAVLIEFMAVIFYLRPATLSKRALQLGYAILMAKSVYDNIVSARNLDEAGRELSS